MIDPLATQWDEPEPYLPKAVSPTPKPIRIENMNEAWYVLKRDYESALFSVSTQYRKR
jgi:hypothetical protein